MIYKRYLLTQLLQIFGLITFVMTAVVILSQFLKFVSQYITQGISIIDIAYLLLLVLPPLLVYIAPITIFCAIFFVYHKLITDSELVVFEAVGVSRFSLAMPAMTLAIIITIVSYCTTIFITPYFKRELQTQQTLIRENFFSSMLEEKVFNTLSKNLIIYMDHQLAEGSLEGIIIYDQRGAAPVIINAQSAHLTPMREALLIELYQGSRQHLNNNGQLEILFFDAFSVVIQYQKLGQINQSYSPEEMYMHELIFNSVSDEALKGSMRHEVNQRLSWPLLNLTLTAIAVSAVLSAGYNRHWKYKKILIGTTCAAVVIFFDFVFTSKSANSVVFTVMLYVILLSACLASLYVLRQQCNNEKILGRF